MAIQRGYYLHTDDTVTRVDIEGKRVEQINVPLSDLQQLAKRNGRPKPQAPGWYGVYGQATQQPFGYPI